MGSQLGFHFGSRARVKWLKMLMAAVLIVLTTVPAYLSLGHEFMPRLNEGTILYMPTAVPGMSINGRQASV